REERREAVGVTVVRCRGEEQTMVEEGSELLNHARGVREDRVLAARGWRGGMRLIEDEERTALALGEDGMERLLVLRAPQGLVRDDDPGMGDPRIHAEAAILSSPLDKGAVMDLELQAKPAGHLALPLGAHRSGGHNEREVDLVAQEQLLEDQTGFDR